jgi:hypothetical protein
MAVENGSTDRERKSKAKRGSKDERDREWQRERERERERWQSLRCVWFERKNEEWKKIMQSNEKTWTNINLKVSSHSKYEFKSEIKKYTLSMLFYTI